MEKNKVMVKRLKIKKLTIIWVFRHKWDKRSKDFDDRTFKKKASLGIFYRKSLIVGKRNFDTPKKWKNNLVPSYMFGLDLLVIKTWIDIDFGGMHLNIED
jgi:hypothetical protein